MGEDREMTPEDYAQYEKDVEDGAYVSPETWERAIELVLSTDPHNDAHGGWAAYGDQNILNLIAQPLPSLRDLPPWED